MSNLFDLKNKTILITGGYGYLGKAITESLLSQNAVVYVLGRNEEKHTIAFSAIKNQNLHFEQCDISDSHSITNSINRIISKVKSIDVLINNAFYSKGQSPETMSDEDWNFGIEGTLNSVFKCIKAIIPHFKMNQSGKIINVSSMYGLVAPQFEIYQDFPEYLNPPHYGAAKAGIIQLTKYYASYLGKFNISVNTVTPGPFPSINVQKDTEFIQSLKDRTCLNRIGQPEDLGGVFVFLASNSSNFITGQNLIVDGGWTCK